MQRASHRLLALLAECFFKQKRAYEIRYGDWSSDVCSSDLKIFVGPATRVGFGPFAPAPEHEYLRAELRAQIHRAHRLLHRVRADARIVGGERAVAKHRIEEQIHRRHRHDEAVAFARALEVGDDAIALGQSGGDGHEIGGAGVDAPRADLGQQRAGADRRQWIADDVAERIAAAVADGPETERELVLRLWRE